MPRFKVQLSCECPLKPCEHELSIVFLSIPRQRLCVLRRVGSGHVQTCPCNLYQSFFVSKVGPHKQYSIAPSSQTAHAHFHTHTTVQEHTISHHCGWPIKLPLIDPPSNNWLMAMTLIIDRMSVLIKYNLTFY